MNQADVDIAFPRFKWLKVKKRPEFYNTGVYIIYLFFRSSPNPFAIAYCSTNEVLC